AMVGALMHLVNLRIDPAANYKAARDAAAKAVELDPNLAEAHSSMGTVKQSFDWDFAGAEAEFKRAIELHPNTYDVHYDYSILLSSLKRHDEAIREVLLSQQLNPMAQFLQNQVAMTYFRAGRFEEGIAQARRVVIADPSDRMAHELLIRGFLSLGRVPE